MTFPRGFRNGQSRKSLEQFTDVFQANRSKGLVELFHGLEVWKRIRVRT